MVGWIVVTAAGGSLLVGVLLGALTCVQPLQSLMLSFIWLCWSPYSRHTASLSAGTQHDCSRSLPLCEEILPSLRGAARRHGAGEVSL